MSYIEGNRFLYLETPLGANKLLLQGFSGTEGLSQLFSFRLDLLAENQTNVNFDTLIGQKVNFGIQGSDSSLGTRHFNGIVVELSQGARDRELTEYRMRIVPDIWRLSRKFQSRIFQHLNVPDILKQVLAGYDVSYQIQGTFEPREYCTQYRETDFNFLSRLMEEEGLYYFFKFSHGAHQLVVANVPSSHPDIPGDPKLTFDPVGGGGRDDERITDWQKEQYWGSGKFTTWDHHFQLPHKKLQGQDTSSITVPAGKVTHKLNLAGNDALEIYDYPAAYAQRFDGINKSGGEQPDSLQKVFPDAKRSVGIWMQQQETAALLIQGVSNCRHMTAGFKFTLQRHFNGDGQYTITQVSHTGAEGDFRSSQGQGSSRYSNRFECIPFALPFRPPQTAKRPLISGPQTAVVVGPSGEEIFTDKYGRVKVQFHWDREGKYDGDSSCWLRVATLWAGKQWGSVYLPRIGHEVIVGFIEGDPDRPVIVGSVYNADTMPPYELPANKTRSGIKSDSSMGSGGFNEIRFEDLKGKEQIFIHGQKDSDTRIENDCREWIGEDRHLIVKRDQYEEVDRDIHLKVVRDHKESIQGDRHLTVQGKEAVQVTGSLSLQVTGNVATQFGANHTEQTTASYYLQAQSIVLEAETSICLTVGSNFISISPAGITIMGTPMVLINSGGAAIPGVPGMLVSPVAPGPAIEADQALAGSEVSYSGGGEAPAIADIDPNKGNWWVGGKEAYKDDKITVKTGVQVKQDGVDVPSRKDSIMIKVKCDKNPHVLQFIYREIIGADGKAIKKNMTTTGGSYSTTTDPANPEWNTDSAASPNPYYEGAFRHRNDPGELTVSDEPSVKPGPGETWRATFKSFIICDGKVTKEITWVRSQKDGSDPTYTVSTADATSLPDWAKKKLKDQGYNDAP